MLQTKRDAVDAITVAKEKCCNGHFEFYCYANGSKHFRWFVYVCKLSFETQHLPLIIIFTVLNYQNWVHSPCKKQLLSTCFVTFASFENLYKLLLYSANLVYFVKEIDKTEIKTTGISSWENPSLGQARYRIPL